MKSQNTVANLTLDIFSLFVRLCPIAASIVLIYRNKNCIKSVQIHCHINYFLHFQVTPEIVTFYLLVTIYMVNKTFHTITISGDSTSTII